MIRTDARDIRDIMKVYHETRESEKIGPHLSEDGFMVIQSANIELLNSEDLANSPGIIVPTVVPKDHSYKVEFDVRKYNDWFLSLNEGTRISYLASHA